MRPHAHTKSSRGKERKVGRPLPPAPEDGTDRRDFLRTALPAGVLCAVGCPRLSKALLEGKGTGQSLQEKAAEDSGMSYEEVYIFAYRNGFIPVAKKMMEKMGRDAYLELLSASSSEAVADLAKATAEMLANNDLAAFAGSMKNPEPLFAHALTYEIVEDSETAFEVEIRECLWAKTFRDADAAEIGYAAICHPDYAFAEGFNPKLRMIRSKTLMQGDECCNHRWVMAE